MLVHAGSEAWARFRTPCATIAPLTQPPLRASGAGRPADTSPPPQLNPSISYTRPNTPAATFARRPRRAGMLADSASSFTAPAPGSHRRERPTAAATARAAPAAGQHAFAQAMPAPPLSLEHQPVSPRRAADLTGGSPVSNACCEVAQPARTTSPPVGPGAAEVCTHGRTRGHSSHRRRGAPAAGRRSAADRAAPGPGSYDDAEAMLRCSRIRTAPAARLGGAVPSAAGRAQPAAAAAGSRARRSFGGDSVTSVELREPARAQDRLARQPPRCARWARPGSADRGAELPARSTGAASAVAHACCALTPEFSTPIVVAVDV